MIPAALLPIVEQCSQARALYEATPMLYWDPLWREALWHGVKALTLPPAEAAKHNAAHLAAIAALPARMAVGVNEAVMGHVEEVKKGNIPSAHNFAIGLDMDTDGLSPGKHEPSIGLKIDAAWCEIDAAGVTTAVALFHDLWAAGSFVGDLYVLAGGLAWAAQVDAPKMKVLVCRHDIGRPVKYVTHGPFGDAEQQVILARVRRALTAPVAAKVGDHCIRGSQCPVLRACSAWQLPALQDAHHALRALGIAKLEKENVEAVRRVVLAMKHVAQIGEARIKAFEEEGQG